MILYDRFLFVNIFINSFLTFLVNWNYLRENKLFMKVNIFIIFYYTFWSKNVTGVKLLLYHSFDRHKNVLKKKISFLVFYNSLIKKLLFAKIFQVWKYGWRFHKLNMLGQRKSVNQ